jgi:5-methylcytosine-specific restriction protein A
MGLYGSAWQELRKAIFAERGHVCAVPGCTRYGGTIDHIIPIARGGEVYDKANLQVLCRWHHDQKTGRESGRKRRRT